MPCSELVLFRALYCTINLYNRIEAKIFLVVSNSSIAIASSPIALLEDCSKKKREFSSCHNYYSLDLNTIFL